ncbi:MAG: homoserine dehydrogenase [Acidobacteria bacterium]|nr:MAG: homoserine dehydrogenase [Acidobacteriota bacterium]
MKTSSQLVQDPSADTRSDYPKRTLSVAIIGFGTVGSSVARILIEHAPAGLRLTHILNRNFERKRGDWVPANVRWTDKIDEVLASDADIIVELIGGLDPAGDWIRRALKGSKSVVTANKQLIARSGAELISLASENGQHIAFGASVAGGIPVISGLQEGLAGDQLLKLCGILNGTCNYILSRIETAGISFEEALREAQKLGFAEADPTEDVEGVDARAKLTILASAGLRVSIKHSDIPARSISMLEPIDFEYAKLLDSTIRQISRAEKSNGQLLASVEPMLVHRSSPLASVEGGQNLVMSTGKFGGETVFAGHGAGGHPTAVAVVSDLISILRSRQVNGVALQEQGIEEVPVSADFTSRHYLRFVVKDEPGIIASLAQILCRAGINIDSVFQKPGHPRSHLPFVITLEPCPVTLVTESLLHISKLPFMVQPCVALPILD